MSFFKDIPILIIGFGSVGKRHYKNLLEQGFKNISVYDPLADFTGYGNLPQTEKLNKKELNKFKVAFICSPNNLHIKHALICAKAGLHLFIEKPLSHNLKELDALIDICNRKKLITMVGCNLRFHPCLVFIKKYLKNLGKIYAIKLEFGYYLPNWRPNADYRANYSAKKKTGGGIILDDVHEFDLLFWLNDFKKAAESKFIFSKSSDLKIETEDICIASFKFKNKVLGLVSCDYLQKNHTRTCKIVGESGNLEWNFLENAVWLSDGEKREKIFEIKDFDLNNGFIYETEYFFDCIRKKQDTFNSLETAKIVLEYCIRK